MARRMIAPDQKINIRNIVSLIYADPGIGKTTLASTALSPILFDFDRGVHRADYRCQAVDFDVWEDAIEQITTAKAELAGYKTVIIDTLGRCQDYIVDYIIRSDYRNPKNGQFVNHNEHDGSLTLKGFGALKGHFINFVRAVQMLGLDLVFIAHSKEEPESKRTRPDIMGGSYAETMKVLDMCGYLSIRGNVRQLNFNPSDLYAGKNGANLPVTIIPEIPVKSMDFLATLIMQMKDRMGNVAAEQLEALALISSFKSAIDAAEKAADINSIIESLKEEAVIIQAQLRPALADRVKRLPIYLEKESGLYMERGQTGSATLAGTNPDTQTNQDQPA